MVATPSDERPRERAGTYPVLGQIVADVQIQASGLCLMDAERFRHWSQHLRQHYPRPHHPALYQMLGGMSLEFARYRAYAAVQLYGLATLGLAPEVAAALALQDPFLADEVTRTDGDSIRNKRALAGPDRRGPGIGQPLPTGVNARRGTAR